MDAFAEFLKKLVYQGLEGFGRYYSVYRAYVESNEDPDNLNRLQLRIPIISSQKALSNWIHPKGNFAGKDYGFQCLPQKGDVVYVEFEHGDLSKPLWSHGYFIKGEKPTFKNSNIKDNYWFRTPKGHTVELDDTNSVIRLTHKGGDVLELNNKGISLVLGKLSKISLGSLDGSAEPAVLGDKLTTTLNKIQEIQTKQLTLITNIIAQISAKSTQDVASAAAVGITGWPSVVTALATLSADITQIATGIGELVIDIELIHSQKITLD